MGRAGRDGKHASCTTLVSAADLPLLKAMVYGGTPSEAAVRGLLREVFAGRGDEVSFSFYDLSQVQYVDGDEGGGVGRSEDVFSMCGYSQK